MQSNEVYAYKYTVTVLSPEVDINFKIVHGVQSFVEGINIVYDTYICVLLLFLLFFFFYY